MKIGIGNDIIDINRFKKWDIKKFENFFTFYEQNYIKNIYNAAGIFSVKESIIKALYNVGITSYNIFDIQIEHKNNGLPIVIYPQINNSNFIISISHCKKYVYTLALLYIY